MKAFLFFGYPDPNYTMRDYQPAVKLYYLNSLIDRYQQEQVKEFSLFLLVWFLRLYWLLLVVWFFFREPDINIQILSIPILACSLVVVYALGLIVRSYSWLHIAHSALLILIAGAII